MVYIGPNVSDHGLVTQIQLTPNLVFCRRNYINFGDLRTKSLINTVDSTLDEALGRWARETWRSLYKLFQMYFGALVLGLVEARGHLSMYNDAVLKGYLIAVKMLG